MKTRLCLFIFVTGLFLQIVTASEEWQDCTKIENDKKMSECSYANLQKADIKLNEIYKKVLNFFDSKNKELLKITQCAWVIYKENSCKQVTDRYSGGTLYLYIYTEQRMGELISLKELWEEI